MFAYQAAQSLPLPSYDDPERSREIGIVVDLTRVLIRPDDPGALKRLAVRMSSPGRPGESIVTNIWNPTVDGHRTHVFETTGDERSDKYVLTDGLAEFG